MSIASGLLLALSQAPIEFGVFALFALIPWLIATRRAGSIEALVLGMVFGVVYGTAGANWLFSIRSVHSNTNPVEKAGVWSLHRIG